MTSVSQQVSSGGALSSVARFVDRVEGIVRVIALPSLVQLVLRFALAVPFWKSGILKWDGFLRLNDTAVTLFTDEFMLTVPGGWPSHITWAAMALPIMAWGPGRVSLDFFIRRVLGLPNP